MRERAPQLPVTNMGWLWLVVSLGLVAAPHLLRLPLWLSALCLGAFGWRLVKDLRGWPLPGTVARLSLTLLGISSVVATYGTLLGREAGVALLTVMLSLKLVEMATVRDATVVVLLGYFLVAAGFLFDQSIFAGIYLFATVVLLTAALVVINHPAAERSFSRRYLQRSVSLMFQALPLMAVLFVLFPRAPSLGLGVMTSSTTSQTGLGDAMTIGDVSALALSKEVAFRVEFEGKPPPADSWYWRGPVLWHTDGRRWAALSLTQLREAGPPPPFVPQAEGLDYTVSLETDTTGKWLPALDIPALVPEGSAVTTDLQIVTMGKPGRAQRYRMRSFLHYRLAGLTPGLRSLALRLPAEDNPRARRLGERWAATIPRAEERVARALRYFRDEPFRYTLRPPLLGSPDPIDEFLFETRSGFCEHYAAALVVLMRAAGIPARVVTGYQGGEFNPFGNYWLVRQADAHAWAEIYLEEKGWQRIDPTAVIPPSRIDVDRGDEMERDRRGTQIAPLWSIRALRWVGQGWDALNYQWDRWIAGYNHERQRELLQKLGLGKEVFGSWVAALASAAGTALLFAAWLTYRSGREKDPAVRLYRRFCRGLARAGFVRGRTEGERAYAHRVITSRPEWADQIQYITNIYQQLRYGHPPANGLRILRQAVARFDP